MRSAAKVLVMTVTELPATQDVVHLVAANVRAELARRGLTGSDLGRVLSLSPTAVSRRLRGVTPLDVEDLAKVSRLLGMTMAEVLGEVGRDPNPPVCPREDSNLRHTVYNVGTLIPLVFTQRDDALPLMGDRAA